MKAKTLALGMALSIAFPLALWAQTVGVQGGGGIQVQKGGGLASAGEVRIAGSGSELALTDGGTLRLGGGATLRVGDGTSPGKLTASGPGLPAVTTSGTEGGTFYAFTVTPSGTLAVTSLRAVSLDANGITLSAGSTLNNGAAGAISGLVLDQIQTGGTYLRFLHTSGAFSVSNSVFNDTGAAAPFNISTPPGTVPASLTVDATVGNSGPRAGPGFENDHGAGTDENAATSTIIWSTAAPPPPPTITTPNNKKTNDTTPVLTGTSIASVTIKVFFNGLLDGTTTSNGTGAWTYHNLSAIKADGSYTVTAKASNLAGDSAASNAITLRVDTQVTPPSNVSALPLNAQVHVTWQASPDTDVIGYEVWRSQAGGAFMKIHTGLVVGTFFCDSQVTNGIQYCYQVRAVDNTLQESH